MDGIDVALIVTDGLETVQHVAAQSFAYKADERRVLQRALVDAAGLSERDARPGVLGAAEAMVTSRHTEAVDVFLQEVGMARKDVAVIGFHGQTVFHNPAGGLTVQLGRGDQLAAHCGIDVVCDMRANDMANGGEGAPLAPVYHRALAAHLPQRPAAFVNIGGVSNVTWVGRDGELLAFDTGPGNALMDDWCEQHTGKPVDEDGALARSGALNDMVLHEYLALDYFAQAVPKSLDRGDFDLKPVAGLDAATGAATLAHLTAASVIGAQAWFSEPPCTWVICGGGRKNRYLMELLAWYAECPVVPAEAIGCDGDAIEAEAWAYMAVRSLAGLPITFPGTTGVREAVSGGVVCKARG